MKLLFFTDVHGSEGALGWVEKNGRNFDAILVGGDITQRGALEFTRRFLHMLSQLMVPVLFVHGNADPKDLELPSNLVSLHGRKSRMGSLLIGGLGGSNLTPFNTPFELPDEEVEKILDSIGAVNILVSHCPPYRTNCDTTPNEENIGSKPVRSYIEKTSPELVLSGHVHEARSTDKIGGTVIANPGPLMFGNYAIVELSGRLRVYLKNEEL